MKLRLISVGLLAGVISLVSANAMAESKLKPINSVEGITEYQLDNGLQVLLFPDQTKETVTVNVTYRVGSKHENYGETGMAHLLEHLVFKGTPKHKDIPAELSAAGARPNGTTWTDRTNYFETFSATEENIEWALSMESSRMVDSFISKEDLDSEMTVVRNEFERGENSPFRVTLQHIASVAYDWHNYGKSTIGARSDLENVPIDRLKAFYKKYYQPDNATLIVAGKFEEKDMLARIEKYFGVIPKPERVLPTLYTSEPAKAGERSVTVRRVGDAQIVGAAYHIPAGSHPDFAAIEVLSQVLGDTPSGRLHKAIVENKLASRVYGFNFQWQEPGLAFYFAEVDKTSDLTKTKDVLLDVVESLASNPITKDEVDRVKRSLIKNIELASNSSERIALDLSEWLAMGDWRLYFLNRDRIEAVTLEDVQRVANTYLVRNNRTLGQFIPSETAERVTIPAVASVADMVEGYTGRKQVAQGELFEPSFDNIAKRSEVIAFKNGTKAVMLDKKTRGESVSLSMMFQYGNLDKLMNKGMVGNATAAMLTRGAAGMSRQEIQDEFDKLKARVSISGGSTLVFASISTTKENLAAVMTLVEKIMKQPEFDAKEFEQYKSTMKVDIEQNLQDPQQLAFNQYGRLMSPYPKGHPMHSPSFETMLENLENLTLDDLKAFHKEFYTDDNLLVSVVGDFDKAEIKKVLEQNFTSWSSKVEYQRLANPYQEIEAQNIVFDTPDKENATFVAALMLPVGQTHPDAPALELGNYIFGGGFLNSRMATRLRQEDGLSYGAGSFISQLPEDDKTTFGAYAICAPQNLDKVEVGFKEEMARLLKDGFTDEEVAAAKSGILQSKKVSRAQDRELTGTLRNTIRYDRDLQWYADYEAKMAELTTEEVNAVMRKYFDLDKISIIKAGDMQKAKSAE